MSEYMSKTSPKDELHPTGLFITKTFIFFSDSQPVDPDSYIYLLRMRDLKKTQEYKSLYLVHLRFHLKHLFQSTILSSKNANNRKLVTSVLGQFS